MSQPRSWGSKWFMLACFPFSCTNRAFQPALPRQTDHGISGVTSPTQTPTTKTGEISCRAGKRKNTKHPFHNHETLKESMIQIPKTPRRYALNMKRDKKGKDINEQRQCCDANVVLQKE
ncbi:hypothetical protein BJ166DRAFT_345406 [Pestalotiopsis sp. NC0098]|nr:hypothetical protein BJ166DRAFT_345406 [Pestalotiopsis sp. NC0098]